jgi:NAD(P)-dependent dehydrogenase (short-subunit alcohol dehydrogenase family)
MFQGSVSLITGASKGLGRALAKALALQGSHVILVARNIRDLESLDDEIQSIAGKATLVPLDLEKHELIDGIAGPILERFGKLDLLIGNAAVLGPLRPTSQIAPNDWQKVISINLTVNWRLLRALSPLLAQSPLGHALFMTCMPPKAYASAYAASKAGLEALVKSYQEEMKASSVKVALFNPGPMQTSLRAEFMPGENSSILPTPEEVALKIISKLAYERSVEKKENPNTASDPLKWNLAE